MRDAQRNATGAPEEAHQRANAGRALGVGVRPGRRRISGRGSGSDTHPVLTGCPQQRASYCGSAGAKGAGAGGAAGSPRVVVGVVAVSVAPNRSSSTRTKATRPIT